MKIYTVCFFGHRDLIDAVSVENNLYKLVCELIQSHTYLDFLLGRDGDFDLLAASVVRRAKHDIFDANSSLIWIQPYLKAEYKRNPTDYETYYDEIEVCETSAAAHPKAAIQIRNRAMVDRSDLCVFYVSQTSGGAWQTMRYAQRQNKRIINLFQTCDFSIS